jgi:hypothetical protein
MLPIAAVSRSGFYRWQKAEPGCPSDATTIWLTTDVRELRDRLARFNDGIPSIRPLNSALIGVPFDPGRELRILAEGIGHLVVGIGGLLVCIFYGMKG